MTGIELLGFLLSASALAMAAGAIWARWSGRPENDELHGRAVDYRLKAQSTPDVIEYRFLTLLGETFRAADRPWTKQVQSARENAENAAQDAATRAKHVQGFGESLADAEQAADTLLGPPRGIGAAWRGLGRTVGPLGRAPGGAARIVARVPDPFAREPNARNSRVGTAVPGGRGRRDRGPAPGAADIASRRGKRG
ncbi:hypothetical protein [Streptomonospora litoralis]|uniref:Secreted protein n=1 Tax=Streptomonospora litoralis TaxID=2498135 RepID=A0A4P6Q6M6_9ACTN|nr:hypothetical protein [Streptomonospora litoralis]QBI56333.1 hypothetical protein EKD16_22900 [Streptomonospora litoralis]